MIQQFRYLQLEFPRLPDFQAVGGNRRGHWAKEYRARQLERSAWITELMALGYPPQETAVMESPIEAHVTFFFPSNRRGPRPDKDNAMTALKDLFDVLEVWRATNRNRSTRGYAGIIVDDRDITHIHLEYANGPEAKTIVQLRTIDVRGEPVELPAGDGSRASIDGSGLWQEEET